MDIRGSQKYVNAGTSRVLQRFPGALDVWAASAGKPRDNGPPDRLRNRLHRLEVAIRGDRKSSLDYIHAQTVKLLRQSQLLLLVHAAARRLLAIAKRRIKNRDSCLLRTHKCHPSLNPPQAGACPGGKKTHCSAYLYRTSFGGRSKTYISS